MKEKEPERYQEYLKKQKERSKKYRETLKKELAKKKPSVDIVEKKSTPAGPAKKPPSQVFRKEKVFKLPVNICQHWKKTN